MSKILVNNNPVPISVDDCGVTVPANDTYTIDPNDYDTFAASSDVIVLLANTTLILNDGGNDITDISDAVDIIKGWSPNFGPTTIVSPPTFFFDFDGVMVGDGPDTLISFSNTGANNMNLNRLQLTCRVESRAEVQLNGQVIGSIKTGAAAPTESFQWYPARPVAPGDLVEVILTKRAGGPDVSVAAHVMGTTDI